MVSALCADIVNGLRSRLSTAILLTAIFSTATVPAFAGERHVVCVAKQHDCGKAATISQCCCGDAGDSSNANGPVESRIQIAPNVATTNLPTVVPFSATLALSLVRAAASPPRAGPVDLPTLFASLLI